MSTPTYRTPIRLNAAALAIAVAAALPLSACAQPAAPPHAPPAAGVPHAAPAAGARATGAPTAAAAGPATAPANATLVGEVADLRAKVARLEAALQQKGMGAMPAAGAMPAGGGMKNDDKMGMAKPMAGGMKDDAMMGMGKPMPGGMKDDAMMGMGKPMTPGGMKDDAPMGPKPMAGGMMDDDGDDDMMGMPPAGAGGMAMATALPGFPGASHIYHIGATSFFLDHATHITLTIPQQAALNTAKQNALLAKAANQRKVDGAEQELWALTASDEPDAAGIEAKLREVEKFRADERLDFIRAVGEAAKVLTDGQRQILLGFQPPQPASASPGAMPAGGMAGHM